MEAGPHHLIVDLKREPGEFSFEARIGDRGGQRVWMRSETETTAAADAALAACLMPAMRFGGTLDMEEPVSPKLLRNQREFQVIQRAWSRGWTFGEPALEEVEVRAPTEASPAREAPGRVAAFFSGGVDSWSTVLDHPELTDLIFVRGFDLMAGISHHPELTAQVEERLRRAAATLSLRLHVIDTNLRQFSDPLANWGAYFNCGSVAAALFLEPLFERVLIAGDSDYETQAPMGANLLVDQLWSTEQLEFFDDGGRYSRVERTERIASHPVVQQTLRVCWHNTDGAYNCGRCRKCLITMITLEALGVRDRIATFPSHLDLDAVAAIEIDQLVEIRALEDLLDAVRDAGRRDLERVVEPVVTKGKKRFGLPASYRYRNQPGPLPLRRPSRLSRLGRHLRR